jgi:hypothetical protein
MCPTLTSKARGYKNRRKPAESADKGRTRNVPVMSPNILVLAVDADIHEHADNNEDNDSDHFEGSEPVLYNHPFGKDIKNEDLTATYLVRHTPGRGWH